MFNQMYGLQQDKSFLGMKTDVLMYTSG